MRTRPVPSVPGAQFIITVDNFTDGPFDSDSAPGCVVLRIERREKRRVLRTFRIENRRRNPAVGFAIRNKRRRGGEGRGGESREKQGERGERTAEKRGLG